MKPLQLHGKRLLPLETQAYELGFSAQHAYYLCKKHGIKTYRFGGKYYTRETDNFFGALESEFSHQHKVHMNRAKRKAEKNQTNGNNPFNGGGNGNANEGDATGDTSGGTTENPSGGTTGETSGGTTENPPGNPVGSGSSSSTQNS